MRKLRHVIAIKYLAKDHKFSKLMKLGLILRHSDFRDCALRRDPTMLLNKF